MSYDRLTRMIEQQLAIQSVIDENAKRTSILEMTLEERINYIRYNYIALVQELSEFMDEVGWKSWSTDYLNSDQAFGELRDVLQFLINLMLVTTQQQPADIAARLERELYAKQARNLERAAHLYDDREGKCPGCKRDLHEVTLEEIHAADGSLEKIRCMCGQDVKESK